MTEPRTHYVYRAYDADGLCLYVGITKNLKARRAQHRTGSPWYRHAVHFRITGPLDRTTALALEREEIERLDPIYNQRMKTVTQDVAYWRADFKSRMDQWKRTNPRATFDEFLPIYEAFEQQIKAESGIDLADRSVAA